MLPTPPPGHGPRPRAESGKIEIRVFLAKYLYKTKAWGRKKQEKWKTQGGPLGKSGGRPGGRAPRRVLLLYTIILYVLITTPGTPARSGVNRSRPYPGYPPHGLPSPGQNVTVFSERYPGYPGQAVFSHHALCPFHVLIISDFRISKTRRSDVPTSSVGKVPGISII